MKIADLTDLEKELWLRNRNNGNLVWVTRDRKIVPIKNMSDSHLINTIEMLRRQAFIMDLMGEGPDDL